MLHRKGAIFLTNHDGLKAFIGINYLMGINKLPSVGNYWEADYYIVNDGIKNLMTKQRFQDNLQNLHFAHNGYDNKSDEAKALYVIFWDFPDLSHDEICLNMPLWIVSNIFSVVNLLASGEKFQKI